MFKMIGAIGLLIVGSCARAQTTTTIPAIERGETRHAYFGDLHLHTSYSLDAYVFFGTPVTPDMAYRYASGTPITVLNQVFKREWPLDFLAVTDHPENLGLGPTLKDPESNLGQSEGARRYAQDPSSANALALVLQAYKKSFDPQKSAAAWQEEIAAANRNYVPGHFTSLIGYEWASESSDGVSHVSNRVHRNILFRGDTAPAPYTTLDSKRPEDLWTYLESNRSRGTDVFAIANHPILSRGLTFALQDSDGNPIDAAYATRRALNEPLAEISISRDSETSSGLSPKDALAVHELEPDSTIGAGSYVRDGLGRGIVMGSQVHANPFKFGVVGTSDTHTGLSESDPVGFGDITELFMARDFPESYQLSPGSLTGVWAAQNTRESIYAALRRKEVFATSGTRLQCRLFAAWNYPADLLRRSDWLRKAYELGVPMGSDLPAQPEVTTGPSFIVWATKAPQGANLERAQIIKLSVDGARYREEIFEVAGRGIAGHDSPSGSAVLQSIWKDPEFDPKVAAVYYLRVVEIPSPRWSTLFTAKHGLRTPTNVPAEERQRAWTSSIWYTPAH